MRLFEKENGSFGSFETLRKNYWSLPSRKEARENWLVSGVNIFVWGLRWGSDGVPQGPRLLIHGPSGEVG